LTAEALENTAFGQTSRTFTAGLFSNELTLTLFQSYGATEVETMLNTLFGVESTLVIAPKAEPKLQITLSTLWLVAIWKPSHRLFQPLESSQSLRRRSWAEHSHATSPPDPSNPIPTKENT
jgi:hypothetical protein